MLLSAASPKAITPYVLPLPAIVIPAPSEAELPPFITKSSAYEYPSPSGSVVPIPTFPAIFAPPAKVAREAFEILKAAVLVVAFQK